MDYIKRDLEDKIIALSKEYSCILITGSRQVGKTTVLRQLMREDREYVTLDDLEERALAKRDPAMFLAAHGTPIMVDEVQYAPELFSYNKIEIDNGAAPGPAVNFSQHSDFLTKLPFLAETAPLSVCVRSCLR